MVDTKVAHEKALAAFLGGEDDPMSWSEEAAPGAGGDERGRPESLRVGERDAEEADGEGEDEADGEEGGEAEVVSASSPSPPPPPPSRVKREPARKAPPMEASSHPGSAIASNQTTALHGSGEKTGKEASRWHTDTPRPPPQAAVVEVGEVDWENEELGRDEREIAAIRAEVKRKRKVDKMMQDEAAQAGDGVVVRKAIAELSDVDISILGADAIEEQETDVKKGRHAESERREQERKKRERELQRLEKDMSVTASALVQRRQQHGKALPNEQGLSEELQRVFGGHAQ